jgi:hypothetical protein
MCTKGLGHIALGQAGGLLAGGGGRCTDIDMMPCYVSWIFLLTLFEQALHHTVCAFCQLLAPWFWLMLHADLLLCNRCMNHNHEPVNTSYDLSGVL